MLETALKDWKPGDAARGRAARAAAASKAVTVYLVDKPAAAQSVLAVGQVGVPRSTPDYFPLTVMNAILGGQFSSRINLNLREDKGYTYGARSSFAFRHRPRPVRGRRLGPDRRDQGGPGRAGQGADRHHRPPAGHRRRARLRQGPDHPGLPRPVRDRPSRRRRHARRAGPLRPARRLLHHLPGARSRPSPRPTSTGSPRSTSTPTR